MTNVHFEKLEQYNDIETLQFYRDNIKKGYTHEEMMEDVYKRQLLCRVITC